MGIKGFIKTKIVWPLIKAAIARKLKGLFKMEWFNGKKTLIGTICIYLAEYIIGGLIIGQIHYSPEWLVLIQTILTWVGGVLVPAGLGHKYIKAQNAK